MKHVSTAIEQERGGAGVPIIKNYDMVNIIRKTLNQLDRRLVDHGSRVAYILNQMLCMSNRASPQQLGDISMMALLHDIGAYKTDEIDNMIGFETKNSWEHAIYGYLFVKNILFEQNLADVLLYHHMDYQALVKSDCVEKELTAALCLADAVDVLRLNGQLEKLPIYFEKFRDTRLSGDMVDLFWQADAKYGILKHLEEETYQAEIELVFANIELDEEKMKKYLRLLAYAIDFRSEYTVSHTIATVAISTSIAEALGFDQEEIEKIYYGALLHDLGKISTPTRILESPGQLTDRDMVIMRSHILMSRIILEDYLDEEICEIACRHHEKINGKGYPDGLKGDQLSESQRVVAVADLLSALSGRRSYKNPFPKERILDILQKSLDNNELCPKIVGLVMSKYDEIMGAADKKSNEDLQLYANISKDYQELVESAKF